MNKTIRYFLLVLLLIVPMTLAACGEEDDNGNEDENEELELNQSYDQSELGVTFLYPEDWVTSEDAGQVFLATEQDVLTRMQSEDVESPSLEEGEAAFIISALSVADLGMDPEGATLDSIFGMITGAMTSEGMTTEGETEDITVGENDAKLQRISDAESGSDGLILAFLEEDGFVMMIVVTDEDAADAYRDAAIDIAATIDFTAPEIDTSGEVTEEMPTTEPEGETEGEAEGETDGEADSE